MTLPRQLPALRLLAALVSLALLAPGPALAQRRVITAPGVKPPDTKVEAKDDGAQADAAAPAAPADEEPVKAEPVEESRPRRPIAPPAAKRDQPTPTPTPTPVLVPKDEAPAAAKPVAQSPAPAVKAGPADEAPRASRVIAPPTTKRDEPPAGPTPILVPRDEAQAPAKPGAKGTVSAAKIDGGEVLYRKKVNKQVVTLRVRPAAPVPNQTTTLVFEVMRMLPVPDPAVGDRVPEEGANLFVSMTREGASNPVRMRLHALKDPGAYGMHFTAAEAGVYRIELTQRLDNAEIGDVPLACELLLGIGRETPMKAAEEDGSSVKASKGRTALKVVLDSQGNRVDGTSDVMRPLGEAWIAASLALDSPGASAASFEPYAKAIAELAAKVPGQVPAGQGRDFNEFDGYAVDLEQAVKDLPKVVGDRVKARTLMAKIEEDHCARCHVKFRFRIADELSAWPKFKPVAPPEPKGSASKPRR